MVITSEQMKTIKYKTQSPQFMCGPMYKDSLLENVH